MSDGFWWACDRSEKKTPSHGRAISERTGSAVNHSENIRVFAKLGVFSPGVTSGGEMLLRLATFGIREFGCEQTGVETHS